MSGWIKLHRSLLDWEWYDDTNTVRLFLHLLLTVNYEYKKWRGETIEPGQVITSYQKLAEQCSLSTQHVRTSIKKLKSTHDITCESTNNYTLITVCNWIKYQDDNTQDNKRITNEQQTDNKRITTTKEYKKERKEYIRQFEELWLAYPRKVNKVEAEKAYIKALKEVDHETLIGGVKRYSEAVKGKDAEYIAHAATWFNDKRWQDEHEQKQVRRPYNPWKN